MLLVVFLLATTLVDLGHNANDKKFKYCTNDWCLADGLAPDLAVDFKHVQTNPKTEWELSEEGYLVTSFSQLGMDIMIDGFCTTIGVPISKYKGFPAYGLYFAKFDPSKVTMQWQPDLKENIFVNLKLDLKIDKPMFGTYAIANQRKYFVNISKIYRDENLLSEMCFQAIARYEGHYFQEVGYKFCLEDEYRINLCLTDGPMIEYKPETHSQNQIWVKNKDGYLISNASKLGIDLGSKYFGGILLPINFYFLLTPASQFSVNLRSAKFDPIKKSMRWTPDKTGNAVINKQLELTSAYSPLENTTKRDLEGTIFGHFTVAVDDFDKDLFRYFITDQPLTEEHIEYINKFKFKEQNSNSFYLCHKNMLEYLGWCLSTKSKQENDYAVFVDIRSDVIHLWEENEEGFVVSSENGYGLDTVSLVKTVYAMKFIHLNVTETDLDTSISRLVILAPFDKSKKSMRWKLHASGEYLVNEDYNWVLAVGYHMPSYFSNNSYFLAVAISQYDIPTIGASSFVILNT